ncbi:MAG: class II aldolase/adducin family protein [Candidatus Lokiarchaeota archaeon]|nr:class II aldolase/adducin family protein [Candidatus Lokiarchaeota archaeon]
MKTKDRDLLWSLKEQVCETAIRTMELGLNIGSAGNVSIRIPDKEELLITPSQIDYELITPYQIAHIDFETKQLGGDWTPSSEKLLHTAVYKARSDAQAIIHFHSRYASVLSATGNTIPALLEEMINALGGEVNLAKFSQVGSKELGDYAVEALGDHKAVLLKNHGALVCGKTLHEALRLAQIVEESAELYYLALTLGKSKITPIPEDAQRFQRMIYEAFNRVKRIKKSNNREKS